MAIIIIDDEMAALNTFLAGAVDKTGLEFVMYNSDPLAAVDFIKKGGKAEATFLDINMPKINGVDLAEKLAAVDKSIKIIFITGYSQDEEKIKARLGKNFYGFLYKPYDIEDLNALLSKIAYEKNREIFIQTFDAFNVYIDGKPLNFRCAKGKELLAILTDFKGGYLEMGHAISLLWPDYPLDNAKRLYRDAVYRLRKDLKERDLDVIESCRASLRLKPTE
jgi:Response regulator containing CheY-like receiver and SARP domains